MATAVKLPKTTPADPELGIGKVMDPTKRPESPVDSVALKVESPSSPPKNPLFPDMFKFGLTGKGKRRRMTRKSKKTSRKTKKRSSRK